MAGGVTFPHSCSFRGETIIGDEGTTAVLYEGGTLHGSFESNWEGHNADFLQNCAHWDTLDEDKVLSFRYCRMHESDAQQIDDSLILNRRKSWVRLKWKGCDLFVARYASPTKQIEISNPLDALEIDDTKEKGENNYAALDTLTRRVNQLAPMPHLKDRDEEANVSFLTKAVIGTL